MTRVRDASTAATSSLPWPAVWRPLPMPAPPASSRTEPWNVGVQKQLFVDRRFIAASENVALTMNRAAKLGIVLHSEKERWEYGTGRYFRVLEDDGKFKLYYGAFTEAGDSLCYAESTDGLHWTKPALSPVEVRGNKRNNLIFHDGAIDAKVRWKGNSERSALRGNPITCTSPAVQQSMRLPLPSQPTALT